MGLQNNNQSGELTVLIRLKHVYVGLILATVGCAGSIEDDAITESTELALGDSTVELGDAFQTISGATKKKGCLTLSSEPRFVGNSTGVVTLNMAESEAHDRVTQLLVGGVKINAGFVPVSVGSEVNVSRESERKGVVSTMWYVLETRLPSKQVGQVRLNRFGRQALKNKTFYEQCGDQVAYEEKRGMVFSVRLTIRYNDDTIKSHIEGGLNMAAATVGEVNAKLKKAKENSNTDLRVQVSVQQVGGSPQNLVKALSSSPTADCGAKDLTACHKLIDQALEYAGTLSKLDDDRQAPTLEFVLAPYSELDFVDEDRELEATVSKRMTAFVKSERARNYHLWADSVAQEADDLPWFGKRNWLSNSAKYQHYNRHDKRFGTVVAVPFTPVFFLRAGAISKKYFSNLDVLPYPRKPKNANDGRPRTLYFQNNRTAIYEKGNQAFIVSGNILSHYRALGETLGDLGYPTTDIQVRYSDQKQPEAEICNFENGALFWRKNESIKQIHSIYYAGWRYCGGLDGAGYPTDKLSDARWPNGQIIFDNGKVVVEDKQLKVYCDGRKRDNLANNTPKP